MTSSVNTNFKFNGIIDTANSVMQNLNILGNGSNCWVTMDVNSGKWSVIINKAGTSIKSFNDDNILGSITVSGTGLTEMYNRVEVAFPHKDLNDEKDYVIYEIPQSEWYPNEIRNTLTLDFDIINDPIQAGLIGARELKQSRLDKIIQFTTDYSSLGLRAGDIIDVTSTMYGFNSKLFRVITIAEIDGEGGEIVLEITALEYSSDLYNTSGLVRKERTRASGIITKGVNTAVLDNDIQSGLKLELTDAAKALGLSLFFVSTAGSQGYNSGTYYLDLAGARVTIAASDIVIEWTFEDGQDLDIRCRVVSPNVGQNTIDDFLGYTGNPSQYVWPPGSSTGSSGTAYIEWGGDNQGIGTENVRVDIDRLKTVFPTKRYFAIECRGNWFVTRGTKPVKLKAFLVEGGTTTRQEIPLGSGTSPFGFNSVNYVRARLLDGVGVYVDSLYGSGDPDPVTGLNGGNAPGDLMGYFVYDTQTQQGQFLQQLPPEINQ